jgi:predicted MFS family arabinose efflux permease
VALIVRFTLQEPRRGMGDGLKTVEAAASTREVFRLLWSRPSFRALSLAAAMSAFFANGMLSWMPSFLSRSHHLSSGEIGTMLALILGFVGGIGTFAGGMVADRLGKRDRRWYTKLPAILLLVALPFAWLALLAGDYRLAMLTYCVPVLISGAYIGPVLAMTHALVNARARATASAVLFLILNMLGLGLGPLVIGITSDYLHPTFGQESLRYALIATSTVAAVLAALAFLVGSRYLTADLAKTSDSC